MYQKLTDRARRVLVLSQDEAKLLGHDSIDTAHLLLGLIPAAGETLRSADQESTQRGLDHIGTEHLLLGLVRDGASTAAQVLVTLGADLDQVRRAVSAHSGVKRAGGVTGQLP
ncbi:Clp protease N-terminal domain-containing protein [Nonomuraea wenchangensis]